MIIISLESNTWYSSYSSNFFILFLIKVFPEPETPNNSIDLNKLTELVSNFFSYKIKVKKNRSTSLYDIPIYISDNNSISKIYKWRPKRNIDNIIKDTISWQKKYKLKLKKFI